MSKKRPLSDLLSDDIFAILVTKSDIAAKTLRHAHNSPYLSDEISPPPPPTSQTREDRGTTPNYDPAPLTKIILKFSHRPNNFEGISCGSGTKNNLLFEDGQKYGISRRHLCFGFHEETKALLVTGVSTQGTEVRTRTFLKSDDESRLLNASPYKLLDDSLVLSDYDEIRVGPVVFEVAAIRRPEPNTTAWTIYVNKVDNFIRQCKTKSSVRSESSSGLPTVLEPTILGSLGSAGKGSYARVLNMTDMRGRLYAVKIPLYNSLDGIIQKELECLRKLSHVSLLDLRH